VRLNQVTVAVRDLDAAKAFYRLLGLYLIVDSPHYARFECPGGEATFSLDLDPEAKGGASVIYFECDDLDAECHRLAGAGVCFDQPPADQPWLWREARLHDPSGNRICLYHAGANRRYPPWRVDGRTA